jgi:hypothetical protein
MRNKIKLSLFVFAALFITMSACKKDDYINDGGTHNPKVDMTTYDYLASKDVFDSLVYLIDRAGLKEMVNSNVTFFAVTNYSVVDFMKARKILHEDLYQDENIPYTMDSIPLQVLKDSLLMYLFDGKIGRAQMTTAGKFVTSKIPDLPDTQLQMKLDRRNEYGAYVQYVDYVQLNRINSGLDSKEADPNNIPDSRRDVVADIQTSGIETNTGVIHVMNGNHHMFFNTLRTSR